MPYIEYVLNKEYIEKNLCVEKSNPENCCHGKCYLHDQINKQAEPQDKNSKDSNKIVPDNKMDDHMKAGLALPVVYKSLKVLAYYFSIPGTLGFITYIFVPPEY